MKALFTLAIGCFMFMAACSAPATTENACKCACNPEYRDSVLLILQVPFKIKPEFVSAFKVSVDKVAAATRQEPGCVEYTCYQSFSDSTQFFLYEIWKNKAEHRIHDQMPYLATFFDEIKDMKAEGDTRQFAEYYVCPNVAPAK